jgi:predicted nucleic acid-binding protein
VRIAFDSSVLVAGLVATHADFPRAGPWLDALAAGAVTGFWTVHAFAETWNVLTRTPFAERVDPRVASDVVDRVAELCTPTPLTHEDYRRAARRCAAMGLRSGAIFDALHLVAAERAEVDALLTFNLKDFLRFSPSIRVEAPTPVVALSR